jgi:hypothetical protein
MATLKQEAAFSKIIENHGNISKSMVEVGYDPTTAKNPSNLTNSKGWKELMDEYLPDRDLLEVHKAGLQAMKPIGALVLIKNGADGKPEQILKDNEGMIEVEDHAVRHKFLETAYKITGKIGTENPTQFNAEEMNIVFTK